MVVEARFQVFGYSLIPATTWRHRRLCCLPPLLGFASTELMMNVEELGCHCDFEVVMKQESGDHFRSPDAKRRSPINQRS